MTDYQGRVRIRKSKVKTFGDFYDVLGGFSKMVTVRTKARANEVAAARRRVVKKRRARMKGR